ncbi:hypothetical protein ABZ816_15445 [Actinosynnema sp. NPDC047251]|uniref:Uncharacterized protein n=1 Tax=Saccharothrix espanaensis (strain ATCC 51144 / DSM 44229 / JCM 9112 / NBRC 15066 / NRRL 15764) TaxID=1179773 RepID=K0JUK8_SACES|nr:hypothetical protein [Saccharothrix espanaensis]CCH29586.1 hypothetical protein BN6_22650 [Saccharothrix espanaensis DSM 44229]
MTTDWETRINRSFTLAGLRTATGVALGELLGVDSASVRPAAVSARRLARAYPARVPEVGAEALERPCEPGVDLAFVLWDLDEAVADLFVIDSGVPEDEDGGVRLVVGPYRAAHSYVLAVATAIAAARLGASPVWDERTALSDRRVADPEWLLERLRQPPGKPALESALDLVRGTGLWMAAEDA